MNEEFLPGESNDQRMEDADVQNGRSESPTSAIRRRGRLPPELIDVIIELLRPDQVAIAKCALVCKLWVPISRHHLVLRFNITMFNRPLTSQLLLSDSCTIASSIQSLVLNDVFVNSAAIFRKLPNITKLSLRRGKIYDFPSLDLSPLLPNVETLDFEAVEFVPDMVLSCLLSHCPRLRDLTFVSVELAASAGGPPVLQSHRIDRNPLTPELEALRVYMSPLLFPWILARWRKTAPRLMTLYMGHSSSSSEIWSPSSKLEASMLGLLQVVGPSLRVLGLAAPYERLSHLAESFAFLTYLQSFYFNSNSWNADLHLSVRAVHEALSHLGSQVFRELVITPYSSVLQALDLHAWAELALLLESPRFSYALRDITIRLHRSRTKDAILLERVLPGCTAKGIVHYDYSVGDPLPRQ